jgi:hypothetical protein
MGCLLSPGSRAHREHIEANGIDMAMRLLLAVQLKQRNFDEENTLSYSIGRQQWTPVYLETKPYCVLELSLASFTFDAGSCKQYSVKIVTQP